MRDEAVPAEAWDRLATVLAAENDALARLDLGQAAGMVVAKAAALAAIADAAPPARPRLAELDALARENRQLLERAIATQARVLEIVATAARAAMARATPAPCYGAPNAGAGRLGASGGARQGPPMALLRTV